MKNKIFLLLFVLLLPIAAAANDNEIIKEQNIQKHIDDIGTTILNANKIDKRIVFVYNSATKQSLLEVDKVLPSGQVIVYKDIYKSIEDDNELAAGLAREISLANKSLKGTWGGTLNAVQIKAAPKKYEIVADKRAVDYMVNAGYNPVAMIIYINKTAPQKRHDLVSNKNLASKRLAIIYEYILTKYPCYLKNNIYINNEHYQNFLLTSTNNRRLLENKIKSGSKEKLNYE